VTGFNRIQELYHNNLKLINSNSGRINAPAPNLTPLQNVNIRQTPFTPMANMNYGNLPTNFRNPGLPPNMGG